jgi:tetratricopeptide (TPR) repeat protein
MLYDVLPPLVFFTSLGGVILVVSRVVLRVRREQFSQEIQSSGTRAKAMDDRLLRAPGRGIYLVRNRLALAAQNVTQAVGQTRRALQERRKLSRIRQQVKEQEPQLAGRGVSEPVRAKRWHHWLGAVAGLGKSPWLKARRMFKQAEASVPAPGRMGAPKPDKSDERQKQTQLASQSSRPIQPSVRLVTTPTGQPAAERTGADEKDGSRVTKERLSAEARAKLVTRLLRRERHPNAPLAKAAEAIAATQYDQAEDILVPYIVGHAKDTRAYMMLGQAAVGKGTWDEALEIYQQVVKINIRAEGAQAALGRAALHEGKMTLALQALQRAHDQDPANKAVLKLLLTIAKRMDNQVLKKSVLEKLSELKQARAQ